MKPTTRRITTAAAHTCAGFVLAFTLAGAAPAAARETCWSGYHAQFYNSIQYCVSSVLAPEGGATFGPENLAQWQDNDIRAWCEGAPHFGLGETITIRVEGGPAFRRLAVSNGNGKSPETYANSARVKTVDIIADTGLKATLDFPDKTGLVTIDLPKMAKNWIQLKIVDVYPGNGAPNTCLSFLMPDFEYEEELLLRQQGIIK